tara:strand:+ start:1874 stop:2428 length:555 start_codon:yes stop_codon:yes gene_type:complete
MPDPIEVTFSAASKPSTGFRTFQPVWDYLFGHISTKVMNKIGLPQVKKRTLTRAQKVIEKSIKAVLIPAMQENLRRGKHIYKNKLHESFYTEPVGEGSVSLLSSVGYASNIERGTSARPVSAAELQRLQGWAAFKFPAQNPEKIAKLVARSIQKGGNRAYPFIQPALESVESLLLNNIKVEFNE